MQGNFTQGVNNISEQIPTVLLVMAIIMIIGVLALLVGVWKKIQTGGSIL